MKVKVSLRTLHNDRLRSYNERANAIKLIEREFFILFIAKLLS